MTDRPQVKPLPDWWANEELTGSKAEHQRALRQLFSPATIQPGARCECRAPKCCTQNVPTRLQSIPAHGIGMGRCTHDAAEVIDFLVPEGVDVPMCEPCARYHEERAK